MPNFEKVNCEPTIEQSSMVGPLPRIATLKESGGWRFLIDRQDPNDPDMLSGFKIDRNGSIGNGPSLTTGSGGRLNLHRSHFEEATVSNSLTVQSQASEAITLLYTHGLITSAMRDYARKKLVNL